MDSLRVKYTVYSFQIDFRGKVKINSVCDYLQEAAGAHANILGFSPSDLSEKGMFWALHRFSVRMDTYPQYGDTLEIHTWVSSLRGAFSEREFEIFDTKGHCLGEASTLWFAVNASTRKPQAIGTIGKSATLQMGPKKMDGKPSKIPPLENFETVDSLRANYNLLDINYHVNNVRYIDIFLSCLPLAKFKNAEIASLDINFLGEPSNETLLSIDYQKNSETEELFALTNDSNHQLARMRTIWRNMP